MATNDPSVVAESPCQACGACCAYSSNWPRFTTEDDAALDRIPADLVNEKLSGMRCEGERCAALQGKVLVVQLTPPEGATVPSSARFFPERENLIEPAAPEKVTREGRALRIEMKLTEH